MIRKLLLIPIFFLVVIQQSHSQSNLTDSEVDYLIELGVTLEGTYQIQMIDTRALPTVELSLYKIIEEKRNLNKTVYHYLNSNMRIMILPQETIQNSDFISLERIKYISSKSSEYEK